MNATIIYIALAIGSLLTVAILSLIAQKSKPEKTLSPITGIAFGFVLAGIFTGENRVAGYGLMGIGVLLALLDMWKKRPKSQ